MDGPDVQWPSATADPHQWRAFALQTNSYMPRIHEKSYRLCSKEYDKEALIAIDLKDWWSGGNVAINAETKARITCSPQSAESPLQRAVQSENLGLEDALLKQDLVTCSCRIL